MRPAVQAGRRADLHDRRRVSFQLAAPLEARGHTHIVRIQGALILVSDLYSFATLSR